MLMEMHKLPLAGERLCGEWAKLAGLQSTFFVIAWDFPAMDSKTSKSRSTERFQEEKKNRKKKKKTQTKNT